MKVVFTTIQIKQKIFCFCDSRRNKTGDEQFTIFYLNRADCYFFGFHIVSGVPPYYSFSFCSI